MILSSREEFETALDEAQQWAKSVGYKEEDVNDVIKANRLRRRSCPSNGRTRVYQKPEGFQKK